jgi:prepilin peptidase CpaA
MNMNLTFVQFVALVVAAVACCFDVRQHRIPNWITFGAAAAGLIYHVALSGSQGLTDSLGGWLVGVAMFVLPFMLGGLGAGDVKLVAALGAWLGLNDALWLGLYVGASGGFIALAVAVARGYLRRALINIRLLLTHWRVAGLHALPELTIHSASAPKLAYGVSILAGTVVTVWLR